MIRARSRSQSIGNMLQYEDENLRGELIKKNVLQQERIVDMVRVLSRGGSLANMAQIDQQHSSSSEQNRLASDVTSNRDSRKPDANQRNEDVNQSNEDVVNGNGPDTNDSAICPFHVGFERRPRGVSAGDILHYEEISEDVEDEPDIRVSCEHTTISADIRVNESSFFKSEPSNTVDVKSDSNLPHCDNEGSSHTTIVDTDWFGVVLLSLFILVTVMGSPFFVSYVSDSSPLPGGFDLIDLNPLTSGAERATIHMVWYCGWLTAVCTGLGVVPFYLFKTPNKFWTGLSNAFAGGMMLAASASLVREGANSNHLHSAASMSDDDHSWMLLQSTCMGVVMGIVFIYVIKNQLEQHDDVSIGDLRGLGARRVILIVAVMTLHSFSEGVGVGVSFGGPNGLNLGRFISMSLAVHNIPEGVAVVVVMTTNGVSRLRSCLWAIISSIPQPIMAIPAYIFVEQFEQILPVGLGFAAGAMGYVSIFELLAEALEDTESVSYTGLTCLTSFAAMAIVQDFAR